MRELVEFLINSLVDDKSAVKVEVDGETVNVTVSKEDMGKIMGKLTPLIKGKADMKEVSGIIQEKLKQL